jgi:hypothetical protein
MKRTKRVVHNQHFNLARYFAMGTSFVCLLAGLFFIVANPQFSSKDRDLAIYEGGVDKSIVELTPDNRSRNIGLIVLLFGLVSGALGVALAGEDEFDHPTSTAAIAPSQLPGEEPAKSQTLSKEKQAIAVDNLQAKIETLPWLAACIQSSSLVIVGGTGSGKSRLAQCIGMFQCILQQGRLRIGDLDAYQNLERKAWIAGDVYGAKDANAPAMPEITNHQVDELKELIGIAYGGQRSEASQWETYIWDELIKWLGDPYLQGQLQSLINFGVATTRKRNQGFIYLAHGLEKGMFGGESNASGTLASLLEVSPVIYLPTKKNTWGKAQKEDYFFFKPAGMKLNPQNNSPTRGNHAGWELYTFPLQLDPSLIGEALKPLLDAQGITLVTSEERSQVRNTEKSQAFREELRKEFPAFVELEKTAKLIDARNQLEQLLHLEQNSESVTFEQLPLLAQKLYKASNGKYAKGSHSILVVFRNWSKTGGFTGKGAKENFIEFLNSTPGIEVNGTEFQFNLKETD